jgi:hypothetical protein
MLRITILNGNAIRERCFKESYPIIATTACRTAKTTLTMISECGVPVQRSRMATTASEPATV